MDKFTKHIENIIQKVLNEAAEEKATEVSEKLHGNQKRIAGVAAPKDKITADDFKKLRSIKKKETKEQFEDDDESFDGELELDFDEFDPRDKSWEEIKAHTGDPDYSEIDEEMIDPKDGELDEQFFYSDEDNESVPGDYEGDEEEEEEAEELSAQEPTYVGRGLEDNKPGKMFGSFSDDHGWYDEIDRQFSGDFDFDYDEEEFSDFDSFMSKYGKKQRWFAPGEGKRFFDMYKDKFGGVPFRVRTRKMMEQETEEGNAFTGALAKAKESGEDSFEVDGKKYNVKESKGKKCSKCGMVNCKCDHKKEKNSKKLKLSEDELIDLIESIVKEQATKKVKGNIADKTPVGLELTQKVLRQDKKENDDSLKAVTKKMNEYLKDGSKGKFEGNPKSFPKGNGELAKMDKKAYTADSDVEEYIEEFSYGGGMENLDYDEIKPNEEWMEKTLEGSSKTGNSSEYANAVETDLGKKINAKRKKNMFSQEKKNSYNKADQPTSKSEKSKGQKDSDKLFTKLESTEDKNHKLVVEQLDKMKHLFNYNKKTQ